MAMTADNPVGPSHPQPDDYPKHGPLGTHRDPTLKLEAIIFGNPTDVKSIGRVCATPIITAGYPKLDMFAVSSNI